MHSEEWKKSPHVYQIASRALDRLKTNKRDQSIIVSGESGAGKTEAAKCIMKFLVAQSEDAQGGDSQIEQQVLESNPLLEAFGNAKTIRNDNSSRFGKFIKISFSGEAAIIGGWIEHFLLERSRIVQQEANERNYHIFYQLINGADEEMAAELHLMRTSQYRYLSGSGCVSVVGVSDVDSFKETVESMEIVGISKCEQMEVFRIVSAVLRLGNIEFVPKNGNEDAACVSQAGSEHLDIVAKLIGVDSETLTSVLTVRLVAAGRGSITRTPLSVQQARKSCNAFAKSLYEKLFGWLVDRVNSAMSNGGSASAVADEAAKAELVALAASGSGDRSGNLGYIGLLDIYGFEIMKKNSFEQLCINFANEMLQQHFNHHIFVLEQQVYAEDGIQWSKLSFTDNSSCLELIQTKPNGIMVLLDEQAVLGQRNATDDAFLNKLTKAHGCGKHPNFSVPKIAAPVFTVKHFAGHVNYTVDGFLSKNDDTLNTTLSLMLAGASHALVAGLYMREAEQAKTSRKMGAKTTVGSRFRQQLKALNGTLSQTSPHYIRCIKPNNLKYPGGFNSAKILEQLRYCGVLETVRIRCEGFPVRLPFADFCAKYAIFTNPVLARYLPFDRHSFSEVDSKERASAMLACALEPLGMSEEEADWQLGNTKVFLKDKAKKGLDAAIRTLDHNAASSIQAQCRRIIETRRYSRARFVLIRLQARIRCNQNMARLEKARKGLEAMQALLRKRYHAKIFARHRACAIKLQSFARGAAVRKVVGKKARQERAAALFQTRVRSHLAFTKYRRARQSALALQNLMRAKIARRYLGHLKEERADKERRASTMIQSWARSRISRMSFKQHQQAVVIFQTLARARKAMHEAKRRFKERDAAIKIQSWCKMVRARCDYHVSRDALIKIEAIVRMRAERKRLLIAKSAATRLASQARRISAQRMLKTHQSAVKRVAAWERRRAVRARYVQKRNAAKLVQRAMRKSNAEEKLKVAMFRIREYGAALDIDSIARMYAEFPELKGVRFDATLGRQSILHVAAQKGGLALVRWLVEKMDVPYNVIDASGCTPLALACMCRGICEKASPEFVSRKDSAVLNTLPPPPPPVSSNSASDDAATKMRPSLLKRLSSNGMRLHQKFSQPQHYEVVRYLTECALRAAEEVEKEEKTEERAYVPKTGFAGVGLVKLGKILNREKAIVQGYLKKRKLNTRFKKRWFVLNQGVLSYYSREKDVEPRGIIDLEGAMLKRSKESKFTFEIHTPALLDARRNKEGRMYLQAKSEGEVQAWINAIAALPRVNWAGRSGWQRGVPKDLKIISWSAMSEGLNVVDSNGRRPLHYVALGTPSTAATKLCAWLLECGADDNAVDNEGNTALHFAAMNGNRDVIKLLVRRGSPTAMSTSNDHGKTPFQVAQSTDVARLLIVSDLPNGSGVLRGATKAATDSQLSTYVAGAPGSGGSGVTGFVQRIPSNIFKANRSENFDALKYPWGSPLTTENTDAKALCLSILFNTVGTADKQTFLSEHDVFLRVNAVNLNGDALEAPQVSPCACDISDASSSITFSLVYHMKTPLEQLTSGTTLIVEFCHIRDNGSTRVSSWAKIPLQSHELMSSGSFTFGLFSPPVIYNGKKNRKVTLP